MRLLNEFAPSGWLTTIRTESVPSSMLTRPPGSGSLPNDGSMLSAAASLISPSGTGAVAFWRNRSSMTTAAVRSSDECSLTR